MRARIATILAGAACALVIPTAASAAPDVSVTPSNVVFGEHCLGAPSAQSTVVVRNSGNETLTVTSVALTGQHPADFAIAGGGPRGLPPGDAMEVQVTFTPQAAGARNAVLRIESNAPSSPTTVPLSGSGVTRTLEVAPDRLVFGERRIATTSDELVLSLTSVGSAQVRVGALTLGGDHKAEFTVRGPSQRDLDPGEDTLVSIVFRPRGTGERRASLAVDSNACAGRTTIALSGAGTAPKIRVSPGTVDLGSVAVGQSGSPLPIVVSNVGRAPLRITDIAVEGAQAGDFRFDSFPDLPKVLGAGEEFLVNVTFVPAADGARRALLKIVSDDPERSTLTVELAGNLEGAASPSASPPASPTPSSASPSVRPSAVRAAGSGAGDYVAAGLVASLVGGVFAGLFVIRRRRSFSA